MTRRLPTLIALLLLGLCACSTHDDIRARYRLERLLWRAQFFQRRINISFMGASRQDTRRAIDAYRAVIAYQPADGPGGGAWDPQVTADIRRIHVSARIALANLYFLSERYADAGTMYDETLRLGSLTLRDVLDARLGAARSLYLEGDNRAVIEQCARMFREVAQSPEFWRGDGNVDDVFLNIPVVWVRLHREAGDSAACDSSASAAEGFYARVGETWPGSHADGQARLARVQLHMVRGEWPEAARGLEAIVADPARTAGRLPNLQLVLGEIRAFSLSDRTGGAELFNSLARDHPGTDAAYAAQYDLAALRLAEGDSAGAVAAFRDLERARGVPNAVAARAMFARGKILEARGAWDDAYSLFRRLEQLYPFTTPAIEAPLVVTRHYVATGNRSLAEQSVEHARDYYLSLIDRRSRFAGDRAMVQSALAESYIVTGRADQAANILGVGSRAWDDASTAAGMLKAAEVYGDVMRDPGQAADVLKKIIERFPESRYARVAQRRLDELGDRP